MKKRILGLVVAAVAFGYTNSSAQTIQEKNQVLAWNNANASTVKVISFKDYSALSPAGQAEIDALEAKIIYDENQGLTWQDIQTYEMNKDVAKIERQNAERAAYVESLRNGNGNTAPYLSEDISAQEYDQKMKNEQVDVWRQNNGDVKLISMDKYQNMSAADRAYINSIPTKIIYVGKLTWEDIQAYEATPQR